MSSLDYLDLCRLCLVKDRVSVPIFDGEGDVRQIFLKIAACLPVKVAREDKLPKKICGDCVYKVELLYQFWNTTANAEKQLLQWLGEVGLEDKQGYVTGVLNPSTMKQEESSPGGLAAAGAAIQVSEAQPNIGIGVIDNMGIGMPIIIPGAPQQQLTSVPMDTNNATPIPPVNPAVPGPSNQPGPDQLSQSQTNTSTRLQDEDDETSEEEENSDDDCDGDDGLPVKEESEEDPGNSRTIEPTTFVNVSLACDEAGPSGLQQQKIAELPEMSVPQTIDGDSKSGFESTVMRKKERRKEKKKTEEPGPRQKRLSTTSLSPENYTMRLTPRMKLQRLQRYFVSKSTMPGSAVSMSQDCSGTEIIEDLKISIPEHSLHVQEDDTRLYLCTLCDEGFASEQALALHIEVHDDKYPYACDECGRSFKTTSVLRKHQLIHTGEKTNVCEICGYSSLHRSNLVNHQRRHHFDYKYRCDVCSMGFYTKSNYQEHQTIHTREKPFQCQICQASFRYRQGLRLHAKLHQPDYIPPQKKHHCELCNKRFSRKQVLLVHMKTHSTGVVQSEFVCHICGKAVSSKTYLTVHVRKHTGEKPHVCDLCNKGFISQNYLSVHRRTHTGERPHECTHCGKRFTQRTTLVVHVRGHTGDRPYPCNICQKSFASKTMLNSHLKTHAKQNARAQQEQERNDTTDDVLSHN